MDRLATHIDPASDVFRANHERMTALVAQLRDRTARVRLGGDRMTEVSAAARRLRITLLRLVFMRRGRRKRRL